jgi:hypothetical protein
MLVVLVMLLMGLLLQTLQVMEWLLLAIGLVPIGKTAGNHI